MNKYELKNLLEWLKKIGVKTLKELKYIKIVYELKTNIDLLNFINVCMVNQKTYADL